MSTQQDIYVVGSETRSPMLNKENYVPWSSRLLRHAKSRPNGKLIYNSIINGPYVRRVIPEPGDQNREVPVNETFHEQTDEELTEKELKQVEADDQAIQTILLGLPEEIYAVVDSCETAQEIWLRVQQMMKGSDIGIQDKKAKLFNEWERFASTDGESIESYYHRFLKLMNDFKRNKHFSEKIASNLKFLNNLQPEWSRHVTIVHQTKDLHTIDYTQLYDFLKYNQKEADCLTGMNLGQDRQMQMVGGNGENQFRQYVGQNVGNYNGYNVVQNVESQVVQNAVQNPGVQNVGNHNRLIVVSGIANPNLNGNGNVVAARAEGNAIRNNGDLDEIEEVNANCILMANLHQALTSGTPTDNVLVYDSTDQPDNILKPILRKGFRKHYGCALYANVVRGCMILLWLTESRSTTIHKIIKDEIFPIVHQVDARVQNFEIQFLKEASKFVRDFKSLAKEADESLAKHKALELEIERLLRAVISQDIMSIVQNPSVLLYDKAYNDMQAQLGDQKGKSKDTPCVSDTLDPLSHKLENENVELEFQVLNYAKENAHLKTTYKNLFDSIKVTQAQTKTIIDSLQDKLDEKIKC
ncbi:hypothetical protein Tco_1229593 [Tanacetum coccineum]